MLLAENYSVMQDDRALLDQAFFALMAGFIAMYEPMVTEMIPSSVARCCVGAFQPWASMYSGMPSTLVGCSSGKPKAFFVSTCCGSGWLETGRAGELRGGNAPARP